MLKKKTTGKNDDHDNEKPAIVRCVPWVRIGIILLCLVQAFGMVSAEAPTADFTCTPATPGSLEISCTDQSTGSPAGWAWFFGDEDYSVNWTLQTPVAGWMARSYHSTVAMPDGSVVFMGGVQNDGTPWNDTWRSTDKGASWTQMNATAPWTARYAQTSVLLPDKSIILMGGWDEGGMKNDVWRSADNGTSWTQVTGNAGWTPRAYLTSVVMQDGSIVVMGGADTTVGYRNDVWRSADMGATWTQQTASAGWSGRAWHTSVVMEDDSIVLMGGGDNAGMRNDSWRSTDRGATWTQANASSGWSGRQYHSSVAMPDGRILLMGGADSSGWYNDLWQSKDSGATWSRISANLDWVARGHHSNVVMPDGSVLLTGGSDQMNTYLNDTWQFQPAGSSIQNPTHTFSAPGTYQVTLRAYNADGYTTIGKNITVTQSPSGEFNCTPIAPGSLTISCTDQSADSPTGWAWFFGDETYSGAWTQMSAQTPWSLRVAQAAVPLSDGSIVAIGGSTYQGYNQPRSWSGEVWRSTDNGRTWVLVNNNTLQYRLGFSAVVQANDRILVIGGYGRDDVWQSTDKGSNWTKVTPGKWAEWPGRHDFNALALPSGNVVLFGGQDGAGRMLNDTWRSTNNGANWTNITANPNWTKRGMASSVAMSDGRIVLMGGYDQTAGITNDVWTSMDEGITWTQLKKTNRSDGWMIRRYHKSVAMPDGSIVLMGGSFNIGFRDAWRSTDNGTTWRLANATPWPVNRSTFSSVVLPNGSIVVIGGNDYIGGDLRDVWLLDPTGSTLQNPSHTYAQAGTYQVTLQVYNSTAHRVIRKDITVGNAP